MTKKLRKKKKKIEVLEVENEILSMPTRSNMADENNNKEKTNELQGLSDKKDM